MEQQEPLLRHVHIAGQEKGSTWDVHCRHGTISAITPSHSMSVDCPARFATPSLCHPHIHLDKCFLLSHPRYADLEMKRGDFQEALELTSMSVCLSIYPSVCPYSQVVVCWGSVSVFLSHPFPDIAKSRFEHEDLLERGAALIEESISFGVTHVRAFVEVDATVEMKCLNAGLALKQEFQERCHIQICVFAQDPIFSYGDHGDAMIRLLEAAVARPGVEVFGSTPYVEEGGDPEKQIMNIKFAIQLAKKHKRHLDFHIDYNLDSSKKSFLLDALDHLHNLSWPSDLSSPDFRTVVFGHCTRLTLFTQQEWEELARKVKRLPVSFIGLPTSDIFMMGRPNSASGGGERVRGTLQIPQMINKYGLDAAIGINNVGNSFTPQGNCDPLSLASLGVGIYQAGTREDANILLVSCD